MLPPLVTRILLQLSVGGRALKGRARKSSQQAAAWSVERGAWSRKRGAWGLARWNRLRLPRAEEHGAWGMERGAMNAERRMQNGRADERLGLT
jgi:hypothetical protein